MDSLPKPARALVCALLAAALVGCAEEQPTAPAEGPPADRSADLSAALVEVLGGPVDQPHLQSYVASLGHRLAGVSRNGRRVRFVLVSSDRRNAFAAPDGTVVLCAGLMDALPRERAMAAVLAHEVGHVRAGHVGALVEMDRRDLSPAHRKALRLLERRFTPAQEHQADAIALKLLAQAGIDPRGLAEALIVLHPPASSSPARPSDRPRTHPLSADRIRRIHRLTVAMDPVRLAEPPERTRERFHAMQHRLSLWRNSTGAIPRRTALRDQSRGVIRSRVIDRSSFVVQRQRKGSCQGRRSRQCRSISDAAGR